MSGLSNRLFAIARVAETPVSLEARARHAGYAWVCEYSSSAEYDAALIAERRAAGVYGPKRQRRQMFTAAAGFAAGLAVVCAAIHIIS